jgi:hypothetical protein
LAPINDNITLGGKKKKKKRKKGKEIKELAFDPLKQILKNVTNYHINIIHSLM